MCKMSTGVVALFVVVLVGQGCSDLPGLNSPVGGAGGGDGAKGGQAGSAVGSGTAGGSGGRIGAGGVGAGGPGGTTRTGGAPGTGDTTPTGGTTVTGGTTETGGCPPIACTAIACPYGYLPSPDPCGCGSCAPPPDAGVAKDAGGPDARLICPLIACPAIACLGGYQPNSNPCGCPTCAPPDAGVVKDAGGPDARLICPPIACPMVACVYGSQSNPDPCGCPICGPTFDGGVGKDAGRADTLPTACPMLASLNSTDTALFGYSAKRMLLECTGGGVTEICTSNDATGCPGPGSTPGGGIGCSNLCTSGEYGLSYGGVGPLAPPPSIALPAGCGQGVYTPGGVAYYCCPCGM